MTELSYYAASLVVEHFLRNNPQSFPTGIFAGLSTTVPLRDGSNITEPTASEYARVSIGSMSSPSSGVINNLNEILFIGSTTENWGGPQYIVFYDAANAGNFIAYDQLPFAVGNAVGQRISVPAGDLLISIDIGCSYNFAEDILNAIWRQTLITPATSLKLALSTSEINRNGTGLLRPVAGDYADQPVIMGIHNNGVSRNVSDVLFSSSTTEIWNATHVAILSNTDEILGSVISSYVIGDTTGQEVRISADQLSLAF